MKYSHLKHLVLSERSRTGGYRQMSNSHEKKIDNIFQMRKFETLAGIRYY
jgi:hypothetical protein